MCFCQKLLCKKKEKNNKFPAKCCVSTKSATTPRFLSRLISSPPSHHTLHLWNAMRHSHFINVSTQLFWQSASHVAPTHCAPFVALRREIIKCLQIYVRCLATFWAIGICRMLMLTFSMLCASTRLSHSSRRAIFLLLRPWPSICDGDVGSGWRRVSWRVLHFLLIHFFAFSQNYCA